MRVLGASIEGKRTGSMKILGRASIDCNPHFGEAARNDEKAAARGKRVENGGKKR